MNKNKTNKEREKKYSHACQKSGIKSVCRCSSDKSDARPTSIELKPPKKPNIKTK